MFLKTHSTFTLISFSTSLPSVPLFFLPISKNKGIREGRVKFILLATKGAPIRRTVLYFNRRLKPTVADAIEGSAGQLGNISDIH
jgi:hypothetical protein